ncbi:hypothetical protein A6E15_01470 [Natrinema saccharevitans]|uniref:Flagellin n=1 Tax=Natrinema saccharevitans TaxID=301967 RepID=A0A1S8ASF5_9EURY|nr:hypothetical protein A6E15_01470 [Natrinema saccharevitans]
MFERLVDERERGQVGIGTLIVFIAMVLVAAIAAGVLINTAGVLQTQASDTGSETQEAVANQIEVTHAAGQVSGDVVDQVDLTLMKSAGSNAIDLEAMTVQYTSSSTDATLTYEDGTTDGDHFDTEELAGVTDGTSLTTTEDRVKLMLNTAALEGGGGSETTGQATLDLVSDGSEVDTATIDTQPTSGGDLVFSVGSNSGSFDSETITIYDSTDSSIGTIDGSASETEVTVDSGDFSDGEQLTAEVTDGNGDTVTVDYASNGAGLESGSSATVSLVDQSGAKFTYGISVPSTFGNKQVVEV